MGLVKQKLSFNKIKSFLGSVFENDLHAKRVESLANATFGIVKSTSLAVHLIGQGLAQAKGLSTKHAIKQVDRLLSNPAIELGKCFYYWVKEVIGDSKEIKVIMDWTNFGKDKQATLVLSLATSYGRSIPLMWKTVFKNELKDKRNSYEDELLSNFKEIIGGEILVTILADRGFADQKLYDFLAELGFQYVIRFRTNTYVTTEDGETKQASEWVGKAGRAKTLRNAMVTDLQYKVATVVCVQDKGMKQPWCIVSNNPEAKARELINDYAKRWGTETTFRDSKDLRFGMGMSATTIAEPLRRDRLLLLGTFAIWLLTILGAAGESLGIDRLLKANTVKRRTHSLLRQGIMWYELTPTMPKDRLQLLMKKFSEFIMNKDLFREIFCGI